MKRLLCRPAVADDSDEWGSATDFELLFDYVYQGRDIYAKSLGHICGPSCATSSRLGCPGKEYAVSRTKSLLDASVFCASPVKFNQGRWRRSTPMARHVLRLIIMGDIIPKCIETNLGRTKDQKMGKRLTWLVGALKSPMVKFHCVVAVIALNFLEEIMDLLYSDSTILSPDARDAGSTRQQAWMASRGHASVAKRSMDKVQTVKRKVWSTMTDASPQSLWSMALGFLPDGDAHLSDGHGVIMQTGLALLGDLHCRFECHRQYPFKLTRLEHQPETHQSWVDAAHLFAHFGFLKCEAVNCIMHSWYVSDNDNSRPKG